MDWTNPAAGRAAISITTAILDGGGHSELVERAIGAELADVPAEEVARHLGGLVVALLQRLAEAEGLEPHAVLQEFARPSTD